MAAVQPREITMSKRKSKHRRIWLAPSDPDSFAYVAWQQDAYDDRDTVNISIADCHRSISLYCSGTQGIKKIDKLIDMLEEARGQITDGME
jgi:hypothetical protein